MDGLTTDERRILGRLNTECEALKACLEDLIAASKAAAARLEKMEDMELNGCIPQGRDCGDVARRLRSAIAIAEAA